MCLGLSLINLRLKIESAPKFTDEELLTFLTSQGFDMNNNSHYFHPQQEEPLMFNNSNHDHHFNHH